METIKRIEKEIADHKETLESYRDQYQDALGGNEEDSIAELIEDCDFESEDFNIGYEQGYISGMESILRTLKNS